MIIEQKVKDTIKKYNLLNKKDKVVVALSGGKDSTSVLYILHKLGYNVEGLFIDLYLGNWSKKNLENVKKFCEELGVGLTVVDMKKEFGSGICFIKDIVKEKKNLTGCSVCGVLKKWILNKWARRLGADKLVTGHNLNDETQTVLMNFLKGNIMLGLNSSPATGFEKGFGKVLGVVPTHPPLIEGDKVSQSQGSRKFSKKSVNFIQRVKPLFFVSEDEIRKFSKKMKFPVLYEPCPCAFGTYRVETRKWLESLKLSEKEMLKIVNGFQKMIPKLKKQSDVREIGVCENCGESCRGKKCKACEIFECLR